MDLITSKVWTLKTSFDEEIDWDFPVADEYRPYNLSLLFIVCCHCVPGDTSQPNYPQFPS